MAERLGLQGMVQFCLLLYKIPPDPPFRKGGEEEMLFERGEDINFPLRKGECLKTLLQKEGEEDVALI